MAQFRAERFDIVLLRPLSHAIGVEVAVRTFDEAVGDMDVK
jgi:hypothetical protein